MTIKFTMTKQFCEKKIKINKIIQNAAFFKTVVYINTLKTLQ